jgi:regulatory protein
MKGARRPAAKPRQLFQTNQESGREQTGSQNDKVMASAFRILSARSCSEGELRDRLINRHGYDDDAVESCINKLKELDYVNDDRFAQSYASYRVGLRPLGRAKLERELALRKVPAKNIEAALDVVFGEAAEETLIDKAIQRRIRTHGRPADRAAAKRMFDHLARRGFQFDLIVKKLRALQAGLDESN